MTSAVCVETHDPGSGLRCAIAVDDTTRGPGLGGVRWAQYAGAAAAAREARRLAAAMTAKNALAQLLFGGAKSVIFAPDARALDAAGRERVLDAFACAVAELDGAYLPGVDMGTSPADLARIGAAGVDVACDLVDPSPWTALGVHAAIAAAVEHRLSCGLRGLRVSVQGAGHVGAHLARLLAADGAEVLIADLDDARARAVAARVGGRVIDPAGALTVDCDVLAPCAAARVLDAAAVDAVRATVVAGAANDVLGDDAAADRLAARGIAFVPDVVASAGGVIHIQAGRAGWDEHRLRDGVLAIGPRARSVLEEAGGASTVAVARRRTAAILRREAVAA